MSQQHDFSRVGPEGMFGERLFIIMTAPPDEAAAAAVRAGGARQAHLAYVRGLEAEGVVFAAGPLLGEDDKPSGTGMIVVRASSVEEARAIAEGDPMHREGLRTFTLLPWKVNEGSVTVNVRCSEAGR